MREPVRTRRAMLPVLIVLTAAVPALAAGVIDGPTLTMDPNGMTPLAGLVEMTTDEAVPVRLTIDDGTDARSIDFPAAVEHAIPVLGLKPDRTYTVTVELLPGGLVGTFFPTTAPLPAEFPAIDVHVSNPAAMEPGLTMLDCMRWPNGDPRPTYSAIVDAAGEVVWYTTQCMQATRMMPDGRIYFASGDRLGVIVADLLMNQTKLLLDDPGLNLHHDMLRTPHGTWLSLTQTQIDVPSFPTSTTDPSAPPAPATLVDDSIVEFLPDGQLRREWRLYDMLDTQRINYSSLNSNADGLDWTHSNAVHYRQSDDSIIVSVRHQDAVIKFSRETGDLQWILGPHENWSSAFQSHLLTPVGTPFLWQFHQHAPMWTDTGSLLLFDNGNYRASPFDGTTPLQPEESFSRAVEYRIDEQDMEVTQVWEYGEGLAETIYTSFISDADAQPTTGNRLITFGGTSYLGGVPTADLGLGTNVARLVEATGTTPPTAVFDMTVYDPTGGRVIMYRSERIPDLYAQEFTQPPNGVGDTLRVDKTPGGVELRWTAAPTDADHDAADHYRVYASAQAADGFSMAESLAGVAWDTDLEAGALTCFRVVAGNIAGTSGDEPAP